MKKATETSRQSNSLATAKPRRGSTRRDAQQQARDSDTQIAFDIARHLAAALHQLLGPMCEVVLHDFADLEHSIVHIEGDVTHRAIGGAATDLILERVAQNDTAQDLYGYATSLPGGRMMKSSTVFLRDKDDSAIGALCVNLDVTDFVAIRNSLNAFVQTKDNERTTETLSDNIFDTVQSAVAETLYEAGRSLPSMSREDKIELMNQLESKGLFQVKRAVPIVADMLGLSRATVTTICVEGAMVTTAKMDMPKLEVILTDPDAAPTPSSGYSQALRIGNFVVTSGYLGTHPDGSGVVKGGFEAEVRRALDNIQAVLLKAGCSMADVIRVNVSLTDVNKFSEMDRIYKDYFKAPYPTRNTIGVKELWGGAQVGFDVWAMVSDKT